MGSEQKQKENNGGQLTVDVDTSPPFASVMEVVDRFGGSGFWRPHLLNPTQPLQSNSATKEERILEARETRFEELKTNLQEEEEVKVEANPPMTGNNEVRVELSENEILKRVKEATEDVKHCTRILEEVLRRVEATRNGAHFDSDAVVVARPIMSIGQILTRKLTLAGERPGKSCMRWKASLAEILGNGKKRGGGGGGDKGAPGKRMKLGFGGISLMVARKKTCKQSR